MSLDHISHFANRLNQPVSDNAAQRPALPIPITGDQGLAQIKGSSKTSIHSDLSQFATWGGSGLSVGRLIASVLRLPGRMIAKTGTAIESAGAKINHSGARFVVNNTGSGIKNLGNILGAAAGLAGHVVTLAERSLINSLKGLAGISIASLGLATGLLSLGLLGSALRSTGTALIKEAFMTRGEAAQKLTPAKAAEIKPLLALQRVVGSSHHQPLPAGFKALEKTDIPIRFQRYYESAKTNGGNSFLKTGSTTSALRVGISQGPNGHIYVAFKGTDAKPGTWTADILGAFGVADSTFRMARDLVGGLAKLHGAERIHVQGHSLGGALAQFAGIKAGVASVTCFNSFGLNGTLCDKLVDLKELGTGKLRRATQVEHFNSSSDPLSQGLQNRYLPLGLSQLGTRYEIEDSGGHGFPRLQAAINDLASNNGTQNLSRVSNPYLDDAQSPG